MKAGAPKLTPMERAIKRKCREEIKLMEIDEKIKALRKRRRVANKLYGEALRKIGELATGRKL